MYLLVATVICGRAEGMVHSVSIVAIPCIMYIALYRRVLFSSFEHISSLLLLFSLSILFLRALAQYHSLHWTGIPHLFLS